MREGRSSQVPGPTGVRSLAGLVAEVRGHLMRSLLRAGAAWGGAMAAGVLVLAWLFGSGGWRPGSWTPLLLDAVVLLALVTLVALGRHARGSWLSPEAVGRAVEQGAGLADGAVRGALELGRSAPDGVSLALVARGERAVLSALHDRLGAGRSDRLAGGLAVRVRQVATLGMRSFVVVGVIAAGLAIVSPRRAASAWGGLASPLEVRSGAGLAPISVLPGDVDVARGAGVTVRVHAPQRREADLVWQAEGDVVRRERLVVDGDSARFVFAAVTSPFTYEVRTPDGATSPRFRVTPTDPLFVGEVTVELAFAPHTGRPPEQYSGDIPALEVPEGTVLDITGRASAELAGVILRSEGDSVRLEVNGADFSGRWTPATSALWQWRIVDASGEGPATLPAPLDVRVLPDLAPDVAILAPPPESAIPLSFEVPLVVTAADDHGVRALELVAWRVDALGVEHAPVAQRLDAGDAPRVLVRPLLDLTGWGLLPGDEVHLIARAVDNHPRAQEARSGTVVLRVPTADGLRDEAGRELDAAVEALAGLRDEVEEAADGLRDAQRQAGAAEGGDRAGASRTPAPGEQMGPGFAEREELARAMQEQADRAARVDSLRAALGQMDDALTRAGAAGAGLGDELEQLNALLAELAGEGERAEAWLSRIDELDRDDVRESLEELAASSEDFEARLDEALERLRRAAARQEFAATAEAAGDLAQRERALAAMLDEEPGEARAAQQEALADEAQAMTARMERLAERLEALGEREAADGVEQARARAAEAEAAMREAAQEARAGDGAQAAQTAQAAAADVDEAAREMIEAQERMMRERAEAFRRALEQSAQDALALARRNAELRSGMQGSGPQALAAMRAEAAGLAQGAENAARNLAVAAQAAGAGGEERPVLEALGRAIEASARTVDILDAPASPGRPSPPVAAEEAVVALNGAALASLAAARALAQGGSSASSAEATPEQLEQLAQQQADVNNMASQLVPMQLTPQAMREQMQQLAQQQQQVASQVGQISDQEGAGPLGDLQALADEAQALATELEQGRLDATTRERQEQLFRRLLDAGRSLEKDDESPEREGRRPGEVAGAVLPPLDAEALGVLRFRPDPAVLDGLPPAARALVLRYFQRLNAGGGG